MTSARLLAEWGHGPDCSCSRTSEGCCLLTAGTLWPESFTDWPDSGTWDATGFYEHPTWGHPTSAPASSSLRGLPTPQAMDGDPRGAQGKRYLNPARSNNLDDALDALESRLLLPTPTRTRTRSITANRAPGGSPNVNLGWTIEDVFWTGDRTDQPSNDGKPSTDPHQPPLSTGD